MSNKIDNRAAEDIFDDVELETPSNTKASVTDHVVSSISPTDIEWSDYVLDHFEDSELVDGKPLVHGLRRVAELLIGKIMESGPTQVFPATDVDHHGRATVVYRVIFDNGMVFSDVADVWEGNTDDMFCVFPVAMASTRAETRALRKALKLRGSSAEEMTSKDTAKIVREISKKASPATNKGEYSDASSITDAQFNFINSKCKQMDIDGEVYFKKEFNEDVSRKITKKLASSMIDRLNEYQQDVEIPEDYLGYKPNWRD